MSMIELRQPGTGSGSAPGNAAVIGHSLLSRRVPLVPVLSAGPADAFAAGLAGHERIERDALRAIVGGDARILKAIYFGNWQRDYSQFIPETFGEMGSVGQFLARVMFDVLDVVAQSEFGQRLDPVRFGTYRWEEHIDNPRGFGIALDPRTYQHVSRRGPADEPKAHPDLWREDDSGIMRYFQLSRDYAISRFAAALRARRGLRGYEYLGAGLHTIEDLFAHSNFVELSVLALGGRAAPMTGTVASTGEPIRDRLGRYRLTTGVFLPKDTISSVSKILLSHIEGVPRTPAAASITDVLIGRFLGPTAQAIYRRMAPHHQPGPLEQAIEERLLSPLRKKIAAALHPALERFTHLTGHERYQGYVGGQRVVIIETSHSLVAKDDPHRPYHPVARQLAGTAVTEIWHEIDRSWRSGITDVHRTALPSLVRRYINHPEAGERWWVPAIRPLLVTQPTARVPGAGSGGLPATRPTLRRGLHGHWVRLLQQRLNTWLAHLPGRASLALDGKFGPLTDAAIRDFQRRHGLPVDGIVGSRKWAALDSARFTGRR